ncbi:hypothetical protein [Nostoc sp. ChiVER01]|uniref:hypothetical protein n=1 Tax=Nostoc sp. ChiVER01 TaxID=3075382 RepID=UPI002AD28BAA|nr:hypothetical protein [Nostoc sp. ChiVER01]
MILFLLSVRSKGSDTIKNEITHSYCQHTDESKTLKQTLFCDFYDRLCLRTAINEEAGNKAGGKLFNPVPPVKQELLSASLPLVQDDQN